MMAALKSERKLYRYQSIWPEGVIYFMIKLGF